MKARILLGLALAGAAAVYARLRRRQADQELWREATDSLDAAPASSITG